MPEVPRLLLVVALTSGLAACAATAPDAPPTADTSDPMNTTTNNPSDLETSTSTDGIRSLEDLPPEQRRQAELFQRAHQQVAPCIRPRIEEIQNISEAGDVRLIVEYGRDGTPLTADLPSDAPARLETNNTYRAVVNAILNGVNECAPLDGMPEEEFDTWRLLPFGLRLAPT